jgi:hypothetical protein
MDHQLNQKTFFQNGETTAVLLQWENEISFGPGMMFEFKIIFGLSFKSCGPIFLLGSNLNHFDLNLKP